MTADRDQARRGLARGSLGLLAEAAHSGTDLAAALLTSFAVSVAVRTLLHVGSFADNGVAFRVCGVSRADPRAFAEIVAMPKLGWP